MTREEAREILTHNWKRVDNPNYSESELDEAFFMAIEALQTDAVSREDTVTLNSPISIQAEMVAVVRCKDCKFWHTEGQYCDRFDVMWEEFYTSPNDFCSRAERRKDANIC